MSQTTHILSFSYLNTNEYDRYSFMLCSIQSLGLLKMVDIFLPGSLFNQSQFQLHWEVFSHAGVNV